LFIKEFVEKYSNLFDESYILIIHFIKMDVETYNFHKIRKNTQFTHFNEIKKMENKTIEQRVYSIVQEVLKVDGSKITPDSKFKDDLGSGSLELVMLIMAMEEEFKKNISDEDALKLVCIKDVVTYIEQRISSEKQTQ